MRHGKSRRASECMWSIGVDKKKGTDQASERGSNQHLLIASGVPGERLICGEGEVRRVGGRKENYSRHSSKNTKECHMFLWLSTDYSGEWAAMVRGLMFGLAHLLLTGNGCSDTPFPKCMYKPICQTINHSTFVFATHYLSPIQFNAVRWEVITCMSAWMTTTEGYCKSSCHVAALFCYAAQLWNEGNISETSILFFFTDLFINELLQ